MQSKPLTFRYFRVFILSFILMGCASKPIKQPNQVEVAQGIFVTLPQPDEYGSDLSLSQLISVEFQGSKQQLPVQLQLTGNDLVLAGFASWGSRLLSLDYDGLTLDTYVMAGLTDTLPPPDQVLFNVMITLWPLQAWQSPLDSIDWTLTENGNHRVLRDDAGNLVLDATYDSISDKFSGDIILNSPNLGYVITIKTFSHSQETQTQKNNG
ncbi:DUF3261 domain-containing protein [Aliivibrio sp. S3MY1]|uniref:DUF3261 domain-containing protein n=1 Tax=unclassified Aliivibrio TaxID=2645654 RepID=UPI002378D0F2|nr:MULTISPECIES: DUF3261 domain-containing protein [unclassified Aliivibrio]MDD9195693.1 DUF3261 domain-containing protein [Aliivibrio sp. S3MY1]MDD9199116.1 DUF3261 domain-containing protein [Aliivibrio sp. S2MY1]